MKKPISKDFKIMLLSVLRKGHMTGSDRESIETYLKTYFDGYTPPELPPLSSEELAELILHYENEAGAATIGGVVAAYERIKAEQPPTAQPLNDEQANQ